MGGRRQSLTKAFAVPLRMKKTPKAVGQEMVTPTPTIIEVKSRDIPPPKVENSARADSQHESHLLSLPLELKLEILFLSTPDDLISLKQVCRSFYNIISSEEANLFSCSIKRSPDLLQAYEVYCSVPLPQTPATLNSFLALQARVDIVDRLLRFIITDILSESFRMDASEWFKDATKRGCFDDVVKDIRPHLLLVGHFLDAFREYLGRLIRQKRVLHADTIRSIQSWILRHYSPYAAQRVSLVYRDLMRSLARKLRPPSFANRTERTLRGWTHDPAKPEDCRDIAIFGGLQSVWRIISMPGYNNRMKATDRFLDQYLGRSRSSKSYEFLTPITQPLEREVAKLARPQLKEFTQLLPVFTKELAAVEEAETEVPVHYGAGFGCKVFSTDYEPEGEHDTDTEDLSLLADVPRQCDQHFLRHIE